MENNSRLLRAADVAALLGDCHIQTIYRMAAKGVLPSHKIGTWRRFRRRKYRNGLKASGVLMMLNEIWLRPGQSGATAFSVFFDTANGDGALFKAEIAPSQHVPAMINRFPGDLIIWGLRGRGIVETEDAQKPQLEPLQAFEYREIRCLRGATNCARRGRFYVSCPMGLARVFLIPCRNVLMIPGCLMKPPPTVWGFICPHWKRPYPRR